MKANKFDGGSYDIVISNNISSAGCSLVLNCDPSDHELAGEFWHSQYVAAFYNSNMELY